MADIIQRMLDHREALRTRIDELKSQIELMSAEIQTSYAQLNELDGAIRVASKYGEITTIGSDNSHDTDQFVKAPGPRHVFIASHHGHGSKKETIVRFARDAIAKFGPMNSRALLEKLDAEGFDYVVGGPDVNARIRNLSAVLSRDDRFVADKEAGGWTYKEQSPQGGDLEGIEDLL